MGFRAHRRPTGRGPLVLVGVLVPFVLVALLWISLAAPFRADGDAARGAGRQATGLRVETVRRDDRARLTITGRVPEGAGPVVVRVLGRPDVAGPCPTPEVRSSGSVGLPDGAVRVGWERIHGRPPGTPLRSGRSFALAGTVATHGSAAIRLCVHLVRAGARPEVLRTVRAIVPSEAGITPVSVVARPALDRVVVPVLRLLVLALVLAGAAWAAIRAWRRFRLIRPRASSGDPGPPAVVPVPWARGELPPLPDGVVVPDVLPWLEGDDAVGGASEATDGVDRQDSGPRRDTPASDDREPSVSGRSAAHGGDPRAALGAEPAHPRAVAPTVDAPSAPAAADARATGPTDAGAEGTGTPGACAQDTGAPGSGTRATDSPSARTDAIGTRRQALRWARRRREPEQAHETRDPAEAAPRHVRAWSSGAEGERLATARFAALAGGYPGVHVLHDRRVPSRAHGTLDHVLVGPAGVIVADTKHWPGTVRIADERLFVRGFDRTKAIDGVCGQVSSVRSILAAAGLGAVPVSGVLHWTRPDGATLDGSLELRGVPLLDATGTLLRSVDGGVLGREGVRRVVAVLERGLPPAE